MIEKINETIKINKYKKLKDSIHDIVISLKKDQWITIDQLSKKLKESNINIPSTILNEFLNEWKKGKNNIFNNDDYLWLYFDDDNKIIFNTIYFEQKSKLGKSRIKQIREEKKKDIEKRKKIREKILINVNEIEKNKKIKCPIPSEVIIDVFEDVNENDIIKIRKIIDNAIKNNRLKFLYEPAWEFMLNFTTSSICDGGLGLNLKNESFWEKHKPDIKKWVIPDKKDLDKGVPIWHFKYGKGKIDDYEDGIISIFFEKDNFKIFKKLKIDYIINNKSIRIDKDYIKNKSEIDGYIPVKFIDLNVGDKIMHKIRGEGKVFDIFNDFIKFKFGNKIVKMSIDNFHKKNILIDEKSFKEKNKRIRNQEKREEKFSKRKEILANYEKVKYPNDIKKGDDVYYKPMGFSIVDKINDDFVTLKNDMEYRIFNLKTIVNTGILYKFFDPKDMNKIKKFNQFEDKIDNESNKDDNDWIKIINKSEIKKGMIVKYNNNIYRINFINSNKINMISNNFTIYTNIEYLISNGVYKLKN